MASRAVKQEYVLLSLYSKLFKDRYGRSPTINKYRERWGMLDAIDSIGYDSVEECLKYYFHTNVDAHSLNYFFNNFDKILEAMNAKKQDAERRAMLMEETRRRVEGEF